MFFVSMLPHGPQMTDAPEGPAPPPAAAATAAPLPVPPRDPTPDGDAAAAAAGSDSGSASPEAGATAAAGGEAAAAAAPVPPLALPEDGYDDVHVIERTYTGFRSHRPRMEHLLQRRLEVSGRGWACSRNQPYKPLGEPVLDLEDLLVRKKAQVAADADAAELVVGGAQDQNFAALAGPEQPLLEADLHVSNGYDLIRAELGKSENRLRSVKAGIRYVTLLHPESPARSLAQTGDRSTVPPGPDDASAASRTISTRRSASPSSKAAPSASMSQRPPAVPPLPLGASGPQAATPSGAATTAAGSTAPIAPGGSSMRSLVSPSGKLPSVSGAQSARGVAGEAALQPHPPPGPPGGCTIADVISSKLRSPFEPSKTIFATRADFYRSKRALNDKLQGEFLERERDRLPTYRRKFRAVRVDDMASKREFDARVELQAMRLQAEKERYMEMVRYRDANPWYITLRSLVYEQDKEVTEGEEQLMQVLDKVVAEQAEMTPALFYGIIKNLPEFQKSTEVQQLVSYLREEVVRISTNDFKQWLLSNNIPVPANLQQHPASPRLLGVTRQLSTRRNRSGSVAIGSMGTMQLGSMTGMFSTSMSSIRGAYPRKADLV